MGRVPKEKKMLKSIGIVDLFEKPKRKKTLKKNPAQDQIDS